jgi:ketosteroid isomerase-like protein
MKRLMATLFGTALCAGMSLAWGQAMDAAPKKTAATGNATADELRQIENDWVDAMKNRNADKLSDILADNWVGLGWNGKRMDKAKSLADLKSTGTSLDSIEMGHMTVRFFGNTAVVTGSDTEKSMEDGKDSSGKYIWTDVFVKQNGKWKAVASQMTRLPK